MNLILDKQNSMTTSVSLGWANQPSVSEPRPCDLPGTSQFPILPEQVFRAKTHNAPQVRHAKDIPEGKGVVPAGLPPPTDPYWEGNADKDPGLPNGWGPNKTIGPSRRN